MTSIQTRQAPLDMLVISQVAAIRKRETALQLRLQSGTAGEAANMAADIGELQRSADRLDRMIEAMSSARAWA